MVADATGGDLPQTLEERKVWLADIIKKNTVTDLPKRGLQITDVIKDVDASVGPKIRVELYWRLASAFAHGRQWASINALIRTEIGEVSPGVGAFRLENHLGRVAWESVIASG